MAARGNRGIGGEAVVFSANHLTAEAETALVDEFRRNRQTAYTELAADLQRVRPKSDGRRANHIFASSRDTGNASRPSSASISSAAPAAIASRRCWLALESKRMQDQQVPLAAGELLSTKGRLWVTRPRPGVDRMSSAWLIRRFIDAKASFGFVTDAKNAPADAVPFDMYGTGFGHEGDRCTFETLVARFGIWTPPWRG